MEKVNLTSVQMNIHSLGERTRLLYSRCTGDTIDRCSKCLSTPTILYCRQMKWIHLTWLFIKVTEMLYNEESRMNEPSETVTTFSVSLASVYTAAHTTKTVIDSKWQVNFAFAMIAPSVQSIFTVTLYTRHTYHYFHRCKYIIYCHLLSYFSHPVT